MAAWGTTPWGTAPWGLAPLDPVTAPTGIELLARIKLDAGDRLVALRGIATGTKFYEPRLIAVGDITRQISVQPGEFRAAEISLELDDSDNFFSDIRGAEAVIGRTVEVLLFDITVGESDATVIAAGTISSWNGTDRTLSVVAQDLSLDRLDSVIADRIDAVKFPYLPDETPRELVPMVIGLVSSAGTGRSNSGALPVYLVDPAIGQAKYRYVACQGDVKAIQNVYIYGVLRASSGVMHTVDPKPTAAGTGYTVGDVLTVSGGTGGTVTASEVDGGAVQSISITARGSGYTAGSGKATTGGTGTSCTIELLTIDGYAVSAVGGRTVIDFDQDPRDPDRSNELAVTADVDGITDDGTSSGNRIDNPALIWQEVMLKNGFAAGEIDSASVTAARNSFAARNVTGGFASIDKDETLRDINEKFASSFNLTVFATRTGKIGVSVPEPGAAPASGQVVFDESMIARGSYLTAGPEDLASSADYFFGKNWHLDKYDLSGETSDPLQVSRLNRDVRVSIGLDYVRDTSSAVVVVGDKMFFLSDDRVVVEAQADAAQLRNVDVGDTITLKHYGGQPFGATSFRVLGAGLGFDGPAMALNLSLIDISQLAFTFGKKFQTEREESEIFRTNYGRPVRSWGVGTGLGLRWN